MDYSDLVEAVLNGDDRTVNQRCADAVPILRSYLVVNLNATKEDAEDAVQRMFEYVYPKIQNGEIAKPTALLSYMLTGTRHSYFKILNKYGSYESIDDYEELQVSEAEQIQNMVDEEEQSILNKCMDRLRDHYRQLMIFSFAHPDAETKDIAERFDISINNAWIRKHRANKELEDCVRSMS